MISRGKIRSILIGGYVLVVALLALVWVGTGFVTSNLHDQVVHTVTREDGLLADVTLRSKLVDDEETGLRGYLLTGERSFLQPYQAAAHTLPGLRKRDVALAGHEQTILTRLALSGRRAS